MAANPSANSPASGRRDSREAQVFKLALRSAWNVAQPRTTTNKGLCTNTRHSVGTGVNRITRGALCSNPLRLVAYRDQVPAGQWSAIALTNPRTLPPRRARRLLPAGRL